MSDPAAQIEAAWTGGDWETARRLAGEWLQDLERRGAHDPRPAFALNASYLMLGDMAKAWTYHDRALQEPADIDLVTEWLAGPTLRQHLRQGRTQSRVAQENDLVFALVHGRLPGIRHPAVQLHGGLGGRV